MDEMGIIRSALEDQIRTLKLATKGNPDSFYLEDLKNAQAVLNKLNDTRFGDWVLYQP